MQLNKLIIVMAVGMFLLLSACSAPAASPTTAPPAVAQATQPPVVDNPTSVPEATLPAPTPPH